MSSPPPDPSSRGASMYLGASSGMSRQPSSSPAFSEASAAAAGSQFILRPEVQHTAFNGATPAPHPNINQLPPAQQQVPNTPSEQQSPTNPPLPKQPISLTKDAIAITAHNFTQPTLGQGGFSVVHQGRFYGQGVAVKVLTIRNDHEKEMFEQELRAMLNPTLWHPNICPLLGYCVEAPAFIFPKLTALNAERMVRLPDDVKDTICIDVANGLAHLHKAGYVHMDMKPDNVLLLFDDQRRIRKGLVGDLGCVKSVTAPVLPFGTIVFLDRQLRFDVPKNPHPADDVFSLGITYLCIWTNRIPSVREEIPALLQLLQQADGFRYSMIMAMINPNAMQRPTCSYVAETLKARQNYTWTNKLYPWSQGKIPSVDQPPFMGTQHPQQPNHNPQPIPSQPFSPPSQPLPAAPQQHVYQQQPYQQPQLPQQAQQQGPLTEPQSHQPQQLPQNQQQQQQQQLPPCTSRSIAPQTQQPFQQHPAPPQPQAAPVPPPAPQYHQQQLQQQQLHQHMPMNHHQQQYQYMQGGGAQTKGNSNV